MCIRDSICNHRWLYEELGITDVMDPEQNIEAGLYLSLIHIWKQEHPLHRPAGCDRMKKTM